MLTREGESFGAATAWGASSEATIQVMVGPAIPGSVGGLMTSRDPSAISITSDGHDIPALVSAVWDVLPHQVEVDPGVDVEQRHRLVFKSPWDKIAEARRFAAAALGVRVGETVRRESGYRVSADAGGPRLPEPTTVAGSKRTELKPGESLRISGSRLSVGEFFQAVELLLECPIEVPEDLAATNIRCDIAFPISDAEAAAASIHESLGLLLIPVEIERAVYVVSPLDGEQS